MLRNQPNILGRYIYLGNDCNELRFIYRLEKSKSFDRHC